MIKITTHNRNRTHVKQDEKEKRQVSTSQSDKSKFFLLAYFLLFFSFFSLLLPLQPRYIGSLLKKSAERKREQELIEEKRVQKERQQEGQEFSDKDAFVTTAYKKKLLELKEFDEKMKRQDAEDGERCKGGRSSVCFCFWFLFLFYFCISFCFVLFLFLFLFVFLF